LDSELKNILIPYPHWPPSNLAGVHRARLIGNYLTQLGYHPIVVTVKPEYYEEKPDLDLVKTVSKDIEVHKVDAKPIGSVRIIGDIGIRAFKSMKTKCLELLDTRKIDFIWIPIPSFYTSLLGPTLFKKSGVPYGIDYIDPWVRDTTNQPGLRVKLSILVAKFLEPIAVKHASLISGVSTPYYQPVLDRNFKNKAIEHVGMPYGFDQNDHAIVIDPVRAPWDEDKDVKPLIYAGAFLPNSHYFIHELFKAIKELKNEGKLDPQIRLYFIGSGQNHNTSIQEYAVQNGIGDIVFEDRSRYPYLHVLQLLSRAKGVMVIGSTEKHYTASKTYQSLLSKKPVFAMFHQESSASQVMHETEADSYLVEYNEEHSVTSFHQDIKDRFSSFQKNEISWTPKLSELEQYSSLESARKLVDKINIIVNES
jgi:hypothetical protein